MSESKKEIKDREKHKRDFNAIGDRLFGIGADPDWANSHVEKRAEALPDAREIKHAVDAIACNGCAAAREIAANEPATCETCGAHWA